MSEGVKHWLHAAGIRALKTMGQTALPVLALWASPADINLGHLVFVVGVATVMSLCTSLAGLPELKEGVADATKTRC